MRKILIAILLIVLIFVAAKVFVGSSATPASPQINSAFQAADTPTATPTIVVTPTETLIPPLELPTEIVNAPALLAWDGTPTYLGDSQPGYLFRVRYDPDIWALTTDSYGYPAIAHRGIEYCVLAPSFGRGLPANLNVEHDIRKIGTVEFEVNTVNMNGTRQFVSYNGGDKNIYTAFDVNFVDNADLCLQEAEVVLGTLTSVKISLATPVP